MSAGEKGWRFEDLEVFKRAYGLSLEVHRRSQDLPRTEQYGGLADQVRRSSKSVCALIAEGSARQRGSSTEFRRYLVMAMGSADETRLWCRYLRDLELIEAEVADRWSNEYQEIARMLQGLIARLDRAGS
jgi:four helix bundle protein